MGWFLSEVWCRYLKFSPLSKAGADVWYRNLGFTHTLKLQVLLEQPNGLARRIVSKAGSDPSRLLDRTEAFIKQQPRVTGDSAQVDVPPLTSLNHSSLAYIAPSASVTYLAPPPFPPPRGSRSGWGELKDAVS